MSLAALLDVRRAAGRPVGVAVLGAGTFASMYLVQARRTPGVRVVAVADLVPERARAALARAGWEDVQVTDDAEAAIAADGVEVVLDATGSPGAGVRHVHAACRHGRHVVMANVEADALAGPSLARRARDAGVVYSLAMGDQPALICELVDWARTCGFPVVAAGKGTRHRPGFETTTPDTVWERYGLDPVVAASRGFNAQMFTSFVDGTKSAIEMAAVANATGLAAPAHGLAFPPCGVPDLARRLRPRAEGGVLEGDGQVEVVSCLADDGAPVPDDLRWGVYVTFRAGHPSVRGWLGDYGVVHDGAGSVGALHRPAHLIGLEVGTSIASVALRGEATGAPDGWRGDVAAVAKRDLVPGDVLDGEGGRAAWGRLLPAATAAAARTLPIGLAHGVEVVRPVRAGELLTRDDVRLDPRDDAVRERDALEAAGPA